MKRADPVTIEREQAVEIIDLLDDVKNVLHCHALGVWTLTPEGADILRRRIERTLR